MSDEVACSVSSPSRSSNTASASCRFSMAGFHCSSNFSMISSVALAMASSIFASCSACSLLSGSLQSGFSRLCSSSRRTWLRVKSLQHPVVLGSTHLGSTCTEAATDAFPKSAEDELNRRLLGHSLDDIRYGMHTGQRLLEHTGCCCPVARSRSTAQRICPAPCRPFLCLDRYARTTPCAA